MRDLEKLFRRGIMEIEPYTPGKAIEEVQTERGFERVVKLASNENPLGPSPRAVAAMKNELEQVHLYPEGPCTALRQALARRLEITEDMVTVSSGADNCILLLGHAFVNEGDEIIVADPTFSVYETMVQLMEGCPIHVKLRQGVHDLDGMWKKITQRTKLIFVCNPNNPTGTIVLREELDDFVAALPDHVILVIDEAYIEFVSDHDCPNGLHYIKQGHKVIVLRTFSKLYGLAGLRIGYALGHREVVAALNRVREPFPVSRVAQIAALAALDDDSFKEEVLKNNEQGKNYLYREFDKMGLDYFRTHSNFVFVNFKQDSCGLYESLLKKGIIVRPGYIWGYPTWTRVTIGTMEQNRAFMDALKESLDRN